MPANDLPRPGRPNEEETGDDMNQVIVSGVLDLRDVDGQLHLPAGELCSVALQGELAGTRANVTATVRFRPGVTEHQADVIVAAITRTLKERGVTVRGVGGQTARLVWVEAGTTGKMRN